MNKLIAIIALILIILTVTFSNKLTKDAVENCTKKGYSEEYCTIKLS